MSTATSTDVSSADVILAESLGRVSHILGATIFLATASLCVMIYDAIITMDQEVQFVWCQRWTFGKAMYIIIKYSSIVLMIGHVLCSYTTLRQKCHVVEEMFVWWQVALLVAGSSVLIIRTWLLWGGKKWFLAMLVFGLLLISAPSIFFVAVDIASLSIVPNPAPNILPGCLVKLPGTVWHPFVFPLIYETFIVVLTVTKAHQLRSRTPVAMRLFRDGTLYYVVIIAVLLVTTIGAAHPRLRTIVVGSGYHIASISVGCSRLFLSLHSWSYENKRLASLSNPNRGSSSSAQSRKSSTVLLRGMPQSQPAAGEYELGLRRGSDVESARGGGVHVKGQGIEVVDVGPSAATAQDSDVRSVLPDIERPSLPERMWSTLPGPHARQQHQQRFFRPPRSSSLYLNGYVPDVRKHSMVGERVGGLEEVDETSIGLDEREGARSAGKDDMV